MSTSSAFSLCLPHEHHNVLLQQVQGMDAGDPLSMKSWIEQWKSSEDGRIHPNDKVQQIKASFILSHDQDTLARQNLAILMQSLLAQSQSSTVTAE